MPEYSLDRGDIESLRKKYHYSLNLVLGSYLLEAGSVASAFMADSMPELIGSLIGASSLQLVNLMVYQYLISPLRTIYKQAKSLEHRLKH